MVDLAKQAFSTSNYGLAAEIYSRNIKEHGPKTELFLGLANSYAHEGNLKKAFEAYSTAFRLGGTRPDHYKELVEALVKMVKQRDDMTKKPETKEGDDMFSCGVCKAIMNDPLTLPCGHSFCRKCLEKDEGRTCKKCGVSVTTLRLSAMKTNVLLQTLTERWFPDEIKAVKLKATGNTLFANRKFKEAIEVYTQAFKCAPNDHLVVSNRSHAHAALEQYQEALEDAEISINLQLDWPKAYFRKGTALKGLMQWEEAAFAYLQCLSLDPSITSAKSELSKVLHKMVSRMSQHTDLKRAEMQAPLPPSQLTNFIGASALQGTSFLDPSSLMELKAKLREKLLKIAADLPSSEKPTTVSKLSLEESSYSKCQSAPNSRPASPTLLGKHRSSSELSMATVTAALEGQPTCKRSCEDFLKHDTPGSPTRDPPRKQARGSDEKEQLPPPRPVAQEKLVVEDFECSLCFRLLLRPVTTPCGHCFCRQCLQRCLDHNSTCPLCKSSLVEYLAERRQATCESLEMIIQTYFPREFEERRKQDEEEMAELARAASEKQEVPIFVCTLAYPTVACPLHVFEPRYRLMIRRAMESGTRQFGMCVCLGDNEEAYADYGTMLEIRDVQYFQDGRSVVDTIGGSRFRVLSRNVKDGYHVAKVEFVNDQSPVNEEEKKELQVLHEEVFQEAKGWLESIPSMPKSRIQQHFGNFPDPEPNFMSLSNGPAWAWWITAVLPLNPKAQLTILTMQSLKERLLALRRVLNFVKQRGGS